jgi:hypothetical protein
MWAGSACQRLVVVMVAGALVGSVVGCGSGVDPAAEANGAASIATTHGGSSSDELVLPINAYGYTVPERDRLGWARDILIGECMRGYGFSYDATANAAQNSRRARVDIQDHGFYGNKRRYGLTGMATAATYGYHLVSTATGVASPADQANPYGLGTLSATGRAVLTGFGADGKRMSGSVSGRQVPAGGCLGAADAKLGGSGSAREAKPVSDLAGMSYEHSLKDPAVTSAFRAWSSCMTGRAYHVADPLDASNGFNLDVKTVSAHETAAARADVACKQQTHLVDFWFNVEVGYQKKWIEQHADQFHKAKSDHDTTMKLVSKIIATAH